MGKDAFWAKVMFREFIGHYVDMSDKERAEDIKKSISALIRLDPSGTSFGAYMVQLAGDRMAERSAEASRANGSLGGRPRKQPSGPMPKDKETVIDFAVQNSLDVADAVECFEATKERDGKDKDGKCVNDWKGFVFKWSKSRKENRKG